MLRLYLRAQRSFDPGDGRLLYTVGSNHGQAGDGFAHDRKRIGHLLADPIVGLLQDPLEKEQQANVGHDPESDEEGQPPLIEEHDNEGEHDLGAADQHADSPELHEVLNRGDVVGDPRHQGAPPLGLDVKNRKPVEMLEQLHPELLAAHRPWKWRAAPIPSLVTRPARPMITRPSPALIDNRCEVRDPPR